MLHAHLFPRLNPCGVLPFSPVFPYSTMVPHGCLGLRYSW
ncbi:unnamed protein product [Acanthoscelides obtectus]|uniref:Uncharacterized protein n=1 Tax=Acanthoscelides obtectus TaxID=200917 RepID=A0A9P0P6I6_ACAOB|nr:unnamed protein product [Acanthoscelides obtectus]CAK1668794.1 hypothetical protein AOBTE_LOCUS26611 [Acanthoscelides obtectus]